jgi:hypothetical protein
MLPKARHRTVPQKTHCCFGVHGRDSKRATDPWVHSINRYLWLRSKHRFPYGPYLIFSLSATNVLSQRYDIAKRDLRLYTSYKAGSKTRTLQKIEELYGACNETNLMHYPSSVYSVTITLHVSGLLVVHRQEVIMYICNKWYVLYGFVDCQLAWLEWDQGSWQSTKPYNTYHLLHIYSGPSTY